MVVYPPWIVSPPPSAPARIKSTSGALRTNQISRIRIVLHTTSWWHCFATIFTARNEVGARLCFYMCLWFCPQLVAPAETRTVGKRAVRILLECFLVPPIFSPSFLLFHFLSQMLQCNLSQIFPYPNHSAWIFYCISNCKLWTLRKQRNHLNCKFIKKQTHCDSLRFKHTILRVINAGL